MDQERLTEKDIERFLLIPEDNVSEVEDIGDLGNFDEFQNDKELLEALEMYFNVLNVF